MAAASVAAVAGRLEATKALRRSSSALSCALITWQKMTMKGMKGAKIRVLFSSLLRACIRSVGPGCYVPVCIGREEVFTALSYDAQLGKDNGKTAEYQ